MNLIFKIYIFRIKNEFLLENKKENITLESNKEHACKTIPKKLNSFDTFFSLCVHPP
jgi:hypothetical protein